MKIHRSYKHITKAQVYYGRDDTGTTRWGEIEEFSSLDVVSDGAAGWRFHPPAWETVPVTCCCKQEFRTTNYLLVCSATLVPDPPFSSKTRVCNSTVLTTFKAP